MKMNRAVMTAGLLLGLAGLSRAGAQEPADARAAQERLAAFAPIREIRPVPAPRPEVFRREGGASPSAPLALRSAEEVEKHFQPDDAKALAGQVDFDRQLLLLFAWRGSGQDRLEFRVAESLPEQVHFTYTGGLTRDLRPHVRLFVLRSDVRWAPPQRARPGRGPRAPVPGDRAPRREAPPAPPRPAPEAPRAPADGDRAITISLQLPSPGWSIRIREVIEVDGELWVVSQASPPPPDVMSPMVLVEGSDRVEGDWPRLPVRHFVLGHPWGAADGADAPPGTTFLRDRSQLPAAHAEGTRRYRAED